MNTQISVQLSFGNKSLSLFTPCFDSPSLCSFGFTSEVFWRPARHSHFLFKILYERLHLFSTTDSAEKLQLLFQVLSLALLIFLLDCFDISFSLFLLELARAAPVRSLLGPSFVRSVPCFSSSSSIPSASTPALALHRSFNPSCSGSVAIKEPHFTGACYRSVSHRTHTSLCSAVKAFITVCARQQGRQTVIVKEGAMIPRLVYVIVICSCVSLCVCTVIYMR